MFDIHRHPFFRSRCADAMTELRRWAGVFGLLYLSVAAAHGVSYNDLSTLTLCVDSSTVQVNIESADPVLDALHTGVVAERLWTALRTTLTTYRVPFEEKASCEDAAGYVYTLFYAHWLYPAGEEPSLLAAAALQVGEFAAVAADPEFVLPDERFGAYTSARLLESDLGEPFHRLLPAVNEEMIGELATAWWSDRGYREELQRASRRALLVRLSVVSGLLTVMIVSAGLFFWRRRKRLVST